MTPTRYPHVALDENGTPIIEESRIKVQDVVICCITAGQSVAYFAEQHPPLTEAQIHGALTYYYDHKAEIDQAIADEAAADRRARALLEQTPEFKARAEGFRRWLAARP